MADFTHVINLGYLEILKRAADPSGLATYQKLLSEGMTEAEFRETLLRSLEFETLPRQGGPGSPPPPPVPGTMEALRVVDGAFATSRGPLHLQGMIVCCNDPATPEDEAHVMGWPLVTPAVLDQLAEHGLNYVHVRLGPFGLGEPNPVQAYKVVDPNSNPNEEGVPTGTFDLSQWDEGFWVRLRQLIAHAESRGIYVELDLTDVWGLDHEVGPWSLQRNINGVNAGHIGVTHETPQPVHETWIRKVVRETGKFQNVIYQDGNESWKSGANEIYPWLVAVRAIVKDELARNGYGDRLFGTNSGNRSVPVDYYTSHQKTAPGPEDKPVLVNEYKTRPVEEILEQVQVARSNGPGRTAFMYWRGEHSVADTNRTLVGLKQLVGGGPLPPVAESCPTLSRWGSSIHVYNRGSNLLPIPTPRQSGSVKDYGKLQAGAQVVIDSTPRFGPGRGAPCNEEKGYSACGGRKCEDPRGPQWTALELPAGVSGRVGGNPFQFHVGTMAPGSYRIKVEPRPDCRDEEGKPVKVGANSATEVVWRI